MYRKLDVTYGKAGTHTFGIVLKNGDKIVSECSTDIVVVEKAAELTPATKLYTLTEYIPYLSQTPRIAFNSSSEYKVPCSVGKDK